MADYRHSATSEIYERRQIHSRINELKMNCQRLKQTKDKLVVKLRDLNKTADQLLAEKVDYIDDQPAGNEFLRSRLTRAPNDLNEFNSYKSSALSSRHSEQDPPTGSSIKGQPSDAFKMKISLCLYEVLQKAEEIAELSEHLQQSTQNDHDAHRDENRKQHKIHH